MKVPKWIADEFGSADPETIVERKSDSKLSRVVKDSAPTVVDMTVRECDALCKAIGYKMQDGDNERVIRYTFTDETVDRYGDIIRAKGVDLKQYKRNPVVLAFHDSHSLPVGRTLKVWYDKEEKAVKGDVLFFGETVDNTGFSETVFNFAKTRAMTTGSVGIMPTEVRRPEQDERTQLGMGTWGVIFEKSELLEFSIVPVPANPNAEQSKKSFDSEIVTEARKKGMITKTMATQLDELLAKVKDAAIDDTGAESGKTIELLSVEELTAKVDKLSESTNTLITLVHCLTSKIEELMEAAPLKQSEPDEDDILDSVKAACSAIINNKEQL